MSRRKAVTLYATTSHGDLLFVQYDASGHPFDVTTRSEGGGVSYYDFDWCVGEQRMYQHESGGGGACEPVAISWYWAAEGVQVREESEFAKRLGAPRGDPFLGTSEGYTVACDACDARMPEERPCRHLFESDTSGEWMGPGCADEHTVPDCVLRAVRSVGCARTLLRELRHVKRRPSPKRATHRTPRIVRAWADYLVVGRVEMPLRCGDILESLPHDDALRWLEGLDLATPEANKRLRIALAHEVRAQNARRRSCAKEYRVWADPRPGDGRAEWVPPVPRARRDPGGLVPQSPLMSWVDARAKASDLRAADALRTVVIRHRGKRS